MLRRDEGFSLAELLVFMAIMALVVAGSWSLLHVVTVSSEQSNEASWISREVGQPLENAERMFSQLAPPIRQAGPYLCEIRTDQDRDNRYEYHTFQATSDGRFIEVFYEETGNPAILPVPSTRVWSTNNRNVATSTPLFRYFDDNGTDISNKTGTQIVQIAASVKVTVVAEQDSRRHTDSRQVFFRNR